MKKIIAKTITGSEFLYNRLSSYQVSNKNADIICNSMNAANYQLGTGELWKVYTVDKYTYEKMTVYRAVINHGKIRFYEIWRAA